MPKTILITGASCGIGKKTAKLFASKGWQVVATMRAPQKEAELCGRKDILVTGLDLTHSQLIADNIASGLKKFEKIDVMLNNAGYGAYGPLEAFPAAVRHQCHRITRDHKGRPAPFPQTEAWDDC